MKRLKQITEVLAQIHEHHPNMVDARRVDGVMTAFYRDGTTMTYFEFGYGSKTRWLLEDLEYYAYEMDD